MTRLEKCPCNVAIVVLVLRLNQSDCSRDFATMYPTVWTAIIIMILTFMAVGSNFFQYV